MAAHPFGPIEKSLIVAYTRMRYHPTRVKPAFGRVHTTAVPDATDHPIHAFTKGPVLQLDLSANEKNCSDYEICVAPIEPVGLDCDLLSRGLGYRITFTMPADKEFNIQDSSNDEWPQVEIAVTDLFGEKVLSAFEKELYQEKSEFFDPSLFSFINQSKTLVIELNCRHVKVVVNGSTLLTVPLSSNTDGSPLSGLPPAATGMGSFLFGPSRISFTSPSFKEPMIKPLERLEYLAKFLTANKTQLTQEKKSQLKEYI